MFENIVSLSEQLIPIRSIEGNPDALKEVLDVALTDLDGFTVERFERNGVHSALVSNVSDRPDRFRVILNGHLDVIPGKDDQYTPRLTDERLYGVGSMDMKSCVACLAVVFKEVAQQVDYPLGLQLVTDEEIGGFDGTNYQLEEGVRADFVVVGESTNLDIENQAKGILWLKISASGRAAHGAYPWKGDNAIQKMADFLQRLKERYPVLHEEAWLTTVNVGTITTDNVAFNKIPDTCVVGLDVRYVPEETDSVLETVERLLTDDFELEVVAKEPALSTPEDNSDLQVLKTEIGRVTNNPVRVLAANGSSDVRHFTEIDCPGVEFGPIGGGMGSDDEWVDLASLKDYSLILKNFLLSLNS